MAETTVSAGGLTRREFLYYIWGASIALFTVEFSGLLVWFMLPRFREGQFGGTFTLPISSVPAANDVPFNFADGRFWLVNLDTKTDQGRERMWKQDRTGGDAGEITGVSALYKVCTHLGCIYSWTPTNHRFECPCHGSKFRLDGRRIESPAPRNLDRFKVIALDEGENELASSGEVNGILQPLTLPAGTAFLRIDTGDRKDGRKQELLCSFTDNCP